MCMETRQLPGYMHFIKEYFKYNINMQYKLLTEGFSRITALKTLEQRGQNKE